MQVVERGAKRPVTGDTTCVNKKRRHSPVNRRTRSGCESIQEYEAVDLVLINRCLVLLDRLSITESFHCIRKRKTQTSATKSQAVGVRLLHTNDVRIGRSDEAHV